MTRSLLLAASAVWLIASPASAQNDQVVPFSGSPYSGTIMKMSKTEVVLEVRGRQQSVAVNEIRRITFADDPAELRRARDDIVTGNYEAGVEDLKKVNPADIARDHVKQDFAFYQAYAQGKLALSGGGDKAAAVGKLLNFVRTSPDNYHFFAAAELLGDLAVALESYDNATRYYSAVSQAPWPEYQLRGAVLEGRALVAQGKFAEAQAKYAGVVASGVDTPAAARQKRLAQVGTAVCLAETGDHETAVVALEDMIAKNDPESNPELFGRAYNALGRCYLKADQRKDALLAYLHVDILFYADPDVHAEALYHLSKLWSDVNKSDRAVSARNLLTTRYAGSAWAKRQ